MKLPILGFYVQILCVGYIDGATMRQDSPGSDGDRLIQIQHARADRLLEHPRRRSIGP
jgi:hypothetical protein